ncbi:hypothetical protein [Stenotrophomonas phage RAS14]
MSKVVLDRYNSKLRTENGDAIHFDPHTMQYYYEQRLRDEVGKDIESLRKVLIADGLIDGTLVDEMLGMPPKDRYQSPYIPMNAHDSDVTLTVEYAVLR